MTCLLSPPLLTLFQPKGPPHYSSNTPGTGTVLPQGLSLDGLCPCFSDVCIKVPQMSPPPGGIPNPYFRKCPFQQSCVPTLPYFFPCVLSPISHTNCFA